MNLAKFQAGYLNSQCSARTFKQFFIKMQKNWNELHISAKNSTSLGVPLYMVICWLSTSLFLHILSPVVQWSASTKMVRFFNRHYEGKASKYSALWCLVDIRFHVYQGLHFIWLFIQSLHTYFSIFYRPLWNVPSD